MPVYVLPAPAPSPWEDVTEADDEAAPIAKVPAAAKRGRAPWYIAGGVLGLLALIAVLAVVIIRVQTAEGTLVVEITDPDVEARIKGKELVLVGADGKEKYRITAADRNKTIDAGQYSIRVEGADGLALNTNEFTLKKNGLVTVRVTLDPKLAKKVEPKKDEAKTALFREVHGASLADLEKWMKALRDDGFIPSYLSAEAGTAVRFTAVAVPNPAKTQWRFLPRYESGTAEADRTRKAQFDAGFRPAILCPHLGDPPNESHVWVADGRDSGGWVGSREFILGKLKDTRAAKFRLTFLTAGPNKEKEKGTVFQFQAVPDGGRDWDAQLELTAADLPDVVAKQKAKGWRVDWLSAYGDGDKLRFQAVFVENPDRAGWDFQTGLTAKEYEERLADAAKTNTRPVAVAGYSEKGQTRYAGVWSKGSGGAATDLSADRKAAEYALSVGEWVRVNDEGRNIQVVGELPKEPFRLTGINLNFRPVSDAALAVFKDCKSLTYVNLGGTPAGDVGLAHFKDCKNLIELHLSDTNLTDTGLEYFKGTTTLTVLGLQRTRVTDEGLKNFKGCSNLTVLTFNETQVGDAGLGSLYGMRVLPRLDLRKTKVTAKGVADLAKAIPQCKIEWDGGTIQPTAVLEPDRTAALYVLSLGGNVQVNDERLDIAEVDPITTEKALPKEPFRLTVANVWGKGTVTPAGFAVFKDCKHITTLWAANSSVTDESLAYFKNCETIAQLNLHNTPVTDAGMAHFKGRKSLQIINFGLTKVGDDGLAHLKECENLSILNIYSSSVTDAGLAHFSGWKKLTSVELHQTQVTDVGLARLAGCKNLTRLTLGQTKVTAKGVADLAKALPQCKIEWDGGTIEPTVKLDADRKAAEYVLSVGGSVKVNDQGSDIKSAEDLPAGPWKLTGVNLMRNRRVTDDGLAVISGCKNLTTLILQHADVSDAGLAHFKECKNLVNLDLAAKKVTDAGLAHFKECKSLATLNVGNSRVTDAGLAHFKDYKEFGYLGLSNTEVTDAGLAHFKGCKKLTALDFSKTRVTDAGLAHFKDCKNLRQFDLHATNVGDAGLAHLKELTSLRDLPLGQTKVTAKGIDELKKALPGCKIEWDDPAKK